MSPQTGKVADNRTAEQIRQDLARSRARMSDAVAGLVEEVHPKTLKNHAVDDAKGFVQSEVDNAKSLIKDENGWRTDRIALVGGALVGSVIVISTLRAIVRHFTRR